MVGGPLPPDVDGATGHFIPHAERIKGTDRIPGQVYPGTPARRPRLSFDDLDRGTPAAEGASAGEASDAGTDDEHSNTLTVHGSVQSAGVMLRLTRKRLSGS